MTSDLSRAGGPVARDVEQVNSAMLLFIVNLGLCFVIPLL